MGGGCGVYHILSIFFFLFCICVLFSIFTLKLYLRPKIGLTCSFYSEVTFRNSKNIFFTVLC